MEDTQPGLYSRETLYHHKKFGIEHTPPYTDNMTLSPPLTLHEEEEASHPLPQYQNQPSKDNCETHMGSDNDQSRVIKKLPTDLMGKHVKPFLKEHIPGIYAPVGKQLQEDGQLEAKEVQNKDSNTRFCYRHRPDSKCRRAADETKMGIIQRVSYLSERPQDAHR